MELLLVRHAIAFDRNHLRWRNDALRPLSPRGLLKMRRAAAGIRKLGIIPSRVLSSPLVRARQTAQLLCGKARWPHATIVEALAPARPIPDLLRLLASQRVVRLAVIGHEPDLGHLLACCIGSPPGAAPVQLRKGGIACVVFDGTIKAGGGRLVWLLTPRVLRSLAR